MIATHHIRELRAELREAGIFDHQEGRTWLELLLLLAVFGGATALTAMYGLPLAIITVPVAVLALTSAAMLGHEGGHGALSSSRFRNELMLHIAFPLIGGLGARYWKHKHNVLHHGHPNNPGVDEDVDIWPMAATKAHYDKSPRAQQWFQRNLQGYAFWPLTTFLTWVMRVSSFTFLAREAARGRLGVTFWTDLAALLLHYVCWLVIPSFAFGFWPVFAFYAVVWGLIGAALSAIFVPAHMGLPLHDHADDNWHLQLATTRNLAMPKALAWFFMGLDRQVEHHLFPRIPHRNLPRASAIVAAWAARVGAPHHTIGYWRGLAEVTRHLFGSWKDAATPLVDATAPAGTPSGTTVTPEGGGLSPAAA